MVHAHDIPAAASAAGPSASEPSAAGPSAGIYAFFDIDGTLIHREEGKLNSDPSPRVRRALEDFTAAGGTCVLCTGRPVGLITPEIASLPFKGFVTIDGAHVETEDGEVIRDICIPPELTRRTLFEMEEAGITALFESKELNVSLDSGDVVFNNCPSAQTAEGVIALKPDLLYAKIVFHNRELDKFLHNDFLRTNFVLYRGIGPGINEITTPDINKGTGLLAFVGALKEKPLCTIAFGDSENDLTMLKAADIGVIMGNAIPSVLEQARQLGCYETAPVLEDGAALALEKLGKTEAALAFT